MSIEAMTLVLNHSKATGRAKLVLIGIANHQGEQGSWPSIETLARYANASERSVIRDIQELEAMGELIVERNSAPIRGQYRPNLYWVNVTPRGVTEPTGGVTESVGGVTDGALRGDTVVTLNLINHKEKQKETIAQDELEPKFKEFWNVYPRKVGKLAARKAFAKALVKVDFETLIDGATRFANDPNQRPKEFIAHPSTWLNEGRWDDEPLPERQLTPEEREAFAKVEREARWAREKAEREARWAEQERERAELEARLKANPVERCEHGRVVYVCPKCR